MFPGMTRALELFASLPKSEGLPSSLVRPRCVWLGVHPEIPDGLEGLIAVDTYDGFSIVDPSGGHGMGTMMLLMPQGGSVFDHQAAKWKGPVIHASADLPLPPEPEWVRFHWDRTEAEAKRTRYENREPLLILDEVQKVKGLSEIVKALWDKSCRENFPIQVIILGSSSLLIQKGLSESLAGRFFLYRCPHWTFSEMEQAFSWDLEQWVFFGGYPGAAPFIDQEDVWSRYVMDSLVETVLAKDVLQLQTISKPALLRHLFMLSAVHPAQILSYNKMLGQLQDAGNTTTLAHYLKLLETAFLISGLDLFKKRGDRE